jgi:hypothetical protein
MVDRNRIGQLILHSFSVILTLMAPTLGLVMPNQFSLFTGSLPFPAFLTRTCQRKPTEGGCATLVSGPDVHVGNQAPRLIYILLRSMCHACGKLHYVSEDACLIALNSLPLDRSQLRSCVAQLSLWLKPGRGNATAACHSAAEDTSAKKSWNFPRKHSVTVACLRA